MVYNLSQNGKKMHVFQANSGSRDLVGDTAEQTRKRSEAADHPSGARTLLDVSPVAARVQSGYSNAEGDAARPEIARQREHIIAQAVALAERFEEIAKLERLLLAAEARTTEAEARLAKAEARANQAEAHLAKAEARANEAGAHRDALLASTSWRMTAPFRRVAGILRGKGR